MNQCKLCSSYALNDDSKHKLCDKCLLKKQIEQLEAEKARLRKLFNKVKPYADYCDGFDMFMGGISLGNILKQALKEVK